MEKEIQSKRKNSEREKEGRGGRVCKHVNTHRAFRMSWAQWRSIVVVPPPTPSHTENSAQTVLGRGDAPSSRDLGRTKCRVGAAPSAGAVRVTAMEREESRRHGTASEERAEEEVEEAGRLTRCSSDTRQQLQSRAAWVAAQAACLACLSQARSSQPTAQRKWSLCERCSHLALPARLPSLPEQSQFLFQRLFKALEPPDSLLRLPRDGTRRAGLVAGQPDKEHPIINSQHKERSQACSEVAGQSTLCLEHQ